MERIKVLGVFRDIMAAKIGLPVLKFLAEQGHEVKLAVEGKAIGLAEESGLTIIVRGSDQLQPQRPSVVVTERPQVVVVGCSSPINWELDFAGTARALEIPVVTCEDTWNALSRLQGFVPNLTLVMDDFMMTVNIARRRAIVGDIASTVDTSVPATAKEALAAFDTATAGKTSIMVVPDHPDNVLEIVRLVANSLRLENDPSQFVCYYSLWHPKYADADQYPQYAHVLPEFARLTEGLSFTHRGQLGTDALARMCDITVGAFTTPLRIALHHGRRAISVWGPMAKRLYQEECGLSAYPLVAMGVIPRLTEPEHLSWLDWERYDKNSRRWAASAKFRPEAGAEAIHGLVEK